MICALIPAAGRSVRMGRPKLLLPWRGSTVLRTVVQLFHAAGVERVLVVCPPDLPELAGVARQAGASVHILQAQTTHMRETIEAGLSWIEKHWQPQPDDAWFLTPADHPLLDEHVVRTLLGARGANPDFSIFVPTWQDQRGHPVLIGWRHVDRIRSLAPDLGLNAYLRQHAAECMQVPVDSSSILVDLDTPEDFERLTAP